MMGIFDRVILTILTLIVAILSAIAILLACGWLAPLELFWTSLLDLSGRWIIGSTAGLTFLIALRFIYYGFHRVGADQTLVHESDLGEVRISLDAVENLVRKVARQVKGVRDVRGWIIPGSGRLNVRLRAVISPDVSVPDVSTNIQNAVRDCLKNVVGVEAGEVRVFVENISNEARRGRVE
jgi:uncharacterized alkaline shock family protein YloU